MTITNETAAKITTTKGTHEGTIESCVAWQREHQGACAEITVGDYTADVDAIDYGADGVDDVAETIAAVNAEIRADLISAVSSACGNDGTGDIGVTVDACMSDGIIDAETIIDIVREAIEDARIEREAERMARPPETYRFLRGNLLNGEAASDAEVERFAEMLAEAMPGVRIVCEDASGSEPRGNSDEHDEIAGRVWEQWYATMGDAQ